MYWQNNWLFLVICWISCVEKLLISVKVILIKFGNDLVHQASHVFSFNGSLHKACNISQANTWNSILYRWLAAGQNVYAVHDFGNNHSWYFLQIWQYETLSASISNHRKSATHLKNPLGVFPQIRNHFPLDISVRHITSGVISVCMKERPHATQISFPIYFVFWCIRCRWLHVFIFHFFKRQTQWAQTFYFV